MRKMSGLVAAFMLLAWTGPVVAESLPEVKVWKSPYCGCCGKWVDHMRAAGFKVVVNNMESLEAIKKLAGIPEKLASCHTAVIGKYKIEGHVPASDIKRLLAEKPEIDGLAVPGMVSGSPGMENGERDPYDVLTFGGGEDPGVFASYR